MAGTPLNDAYTQAHAMLPHLGAGAGQGVEDAYVLARLLSHPETRVGNLEVHILIRVCADRLLTTYHKGFAIVLSAQRRIKHANSC